MAVFTLEVVRARKGDCLILHYGAKKTAPGLMVIDGGPANVYKPQLRARLNAIKKARKLPANKALPIDVLMVSHVDDDHIRGVLELSAELREAKQQQQPAEFQVRELWHNSFDKLLRTTPKQLKVTASTSEAAFGDEPASEEQRDLRKVLASVGQGAQLRDDAKFLGWRVNAAFGEELVMATDAPKLVTLENLELTVLGPMQTELKALSKKHDQWLKQVESGESSLAAFSDPSVTNLSSLVFLVNDGTRTALLTGDARGDKILEGLELTGLVEEGGEIEVDLFKVPHHGSSNNAAPELFERIHAQHYVFSGDGEHGNPERETLEMLLEARGGDGLDLYFTYPIAEIDEGRKADWEKERQKEMKRAKPNRPPRPAWSAAKHGLGSLLKKANIPNRKQKIHIVDDGQALPIQLGDAAPK